MKKKLLTLLLAGLMLTQLAACNGDDDTQGGGSTAQTGVSNASAAPEGFVYRAVYYNLPEGIDYISRLEASGGKVIVLAETYNQMTYINETAIITMNPDGSELERSELTLPENTTVNNLAADGQGNYWVVLYNYTYYDEEYEKYGEELPEDEILPADDAQPEPDPDAPAEEEGIEPDAVGSADEYYPQMLSSVAVATAVPVDGAAYGGYGKSEYSLVKMDAEGTILVEVDLSPYQTEYYFYIRNMVADERGNVYIFLEESIVVIDPDGEQTAKIETDNWIDFAVRSGEGDVYITTYGERGMEIRRVNLEKKELDEPLELTMTGYSLSVIPGQGYSLYLNDYTNLYGYDAATGEQTLILNWIDSDINSNDTYRMACVNEDQIVFTSWDSITERNQLAVLTKTPAADVPRKTTLSYYCNYLDYDIKAAIIQFNKTNPDYRISVTDYSIYRTDEDWAAGYNKMNTDIAGGNIPDLLSVDSTNYSTYVGKGLLADLYGLIDADPELSREDFVPSVLRTLEKDGKLYTISSYFYVESMIGKASVVGDRLSWTVDEMMAAYATLPEGAQLLPYATKDSMLQRCLSMNLNDFVDDDTGKCSFDSPEFISLLKLCDTFPAEYNYDSENEMSHPYEMLRNDMLLLYYGYMSSFEELKQYNAYLNGDYTFIGLPTSGRSGSALSIYAQLGVSAKSANQDGVWQFLKYLLSEEYQDNLSWNFPVRASSLSKMADKAMKPDTYIDENGEEVESESYWYIDGVEVKMEPLSQKDIDKVMELIDSIDHTSSYDENMMSIITEETGSFFAGEKSAEETASLIQNRIQLYISENR